MFITPAYAQAPGLGGGTDMLVQFLPFVLIFVIMYFLIIRPQRTKQRQHQEMVANVRRGDTIKIKFSPVPGASAYVPVHLR